MAPVSLTDVARQAGLQLAQTAVKKGLDLSLDAAGDVAVDGNALLLHELIVNLLDNAIRYTPSGGRIALRIVQGLSPELEVEDDGPGIAESERERVFSPFYRSTFAQQANVSGAGLGLTIVRDIADSHGARITLEDGAGGRGLKVIVRFPKPA